MCRSRSRGVIVLVRSALSEPTYIYDCGSGYHGQRETWLIGGHQARQVRVVMSLIGLSPEQSCFLVQRRTHPRTYVACFHFSEKPSPWGVGV